MEVILDPQAMAETRTEEQDLSTNRRAAVGTGRPAAGQGFHFKHEMTVPMFHESLRKEIFMK